jgi:sigma-B regulation protein RsbU (phosphoserine phosphatase)
MVLLYTDGATEAMDSKGVQFSLKNIAAIVAQNGHHPPKYVVNTILAYLKRHKGNAEQSDDITLVAIRRL